MIYFVYSFLLYLSVILLSPVWLLLLLFKRKHRIGLAQKLGFFLPTQTRPTIWIHAVSVGETIASVRLVKELIKLAPDYRIMFSTTTITGQDVARKKLSPYANIFYFPYDLPGATRRAVKAINPEVLILIDTELWPNIIRASKKHGAKIVIVNGRISDKSFPRYHRFYWLVRYVLKNIDLFAMQSEKDGERIINMGANPALVDVPGNLKFDQSTEPVTSENRSKLREQLGIGENANVLFLGSIHNGEEAVIRAAIKVRAQVPDLRIVIAPRRIDDISWIESELEGSGLHTIRKSRLEENSTSVDSVIVIDTFGELAKLYSIADVAFVGGSFIPHGGQNPLEPSAHGVTPVFGPCMINFREAVEALVSGGGGCQVETEDELHDTIVKLLTDDVKRSACGTSARQIVESNQGASARAAQSIVNLINK